MRADKEAKLSKKNRDELEKERERVKYLN